MLQVRWKCLFKRLWLFLGFSISKFHKNVLRSSFRFLFKKSLPIPCLTYLINQIYDVDIGEHSQILKPVLYCRMISTQVFSTRVENKTSCILVSATHLKIILMTETKYFCTSEDDGDFLFHNLNWRYCKSCVKHYSRKMCELYLFKVFNEWFF